MIHLVCPIRKITKPLAVSFLTILAVALTAPATQPADQAPQVPINASDDLTETIRTYIERSDRYMHHSRLARGDRGFGLTVLECNKIVRFDVEILSVLTGWGPRQDVVLARLSGQNLEQTGPIAGMSGSPIFVRDRRDGKDKMVGALAYAWPAQKDALFGMQPIDQMLTVVGFLEGVGPADAQPADVMGKMSGESMRRAMKMALDPKPIDLKSIAALGPTITGSQTATRIGLVPLQTPLMVSGLAPAMAEKLSMLFEGSPIMPIQAGGGGSVQPSEPAGNLEPGASIAVPLVWGDIDLSAVGTVTDVAGNRVLAFGHALAGEGNVSLPMGPAYVHGVVPNLLVSFKLAALSGVLGTLTSDQYVGVGGKIGQQAQSIPVKVSVHRNDMDRHQEFNYNIVRHRWWTPMLAGLVSASSIAGWSDLPPDHTVTYSLTIDFGDLGKYRSDNIAAADGLSAVMSGVMKPLLAMLNNPLGPPAQVKQIDIDAIVEPQDRSARILDARIDARQYTPGQTIKIALRVQPFRLEAKSLELTFKLPDDTPAGEHSLTICDSASLQSDLAAAMPHRLDPRSPSELLESLKWISAPRGDCIHFILPQERQGVALGRQELPDLPASKAEMFVQAGRSDAKKFDQPIVTSLPSKYVLRGKTEVTFEVVRRHKDFPLRTTTVTEQGNTQ